MAQLNYINIGGHSKIGVNLTDIVGPGAPNKPDDVALIQALLRYIGKALGKDAVGVLDANFDEVSSYIEGLRLQNIG